MGPDKKPDTSPPKPVIPSPSYRSPPQAVRPEVPKRETPGITVKGIMSSASGRAVLVNDNGIVRPGDYFSTTYRGKVSYWKFEEFQGDTPVFIPAARDDSVAWK